MSIIAGRSLRRYAAVAATDVVGATIASETFTGSNGAAWAAQWTNDSISGALDAGAIRDIQSNTGRMAPPTSAYAGNTRAYLTGMTATADTDVLFDVKLTNRSDMDVVVAVRCQGVPNDSLFPQTGYYVEFYGGTYSINKIVSGTKTALVSGLVYTDPTTTPTRFRFRTVGTAIKVKQWASTGSEPGAWAWTGTDSSITAAGKLWLSVANGGAAQTAYFDNITVRAGSTTGGGGSGGSSSGGTPTNSVPGVPTAVSATAPSSSTAALSWSAPATDGGSAVTGYTLSITSADGTFNWSGGGFTVSPQTFQNLSAGVAYTLTVAAVNAVGSGPAASVTVTPGASVPGAPTSVSATSTTATSGTISWAAPASNGGSAVTGYSVSASGGPGATSATVSAATTTYTFTGLATSTAYTLSVSAINAQGQSAAASQQITTGTTGGSTPTAGAASDIRHLPHPFWTTPLASNAPLASTSADYVNRLAFQADPNRFNSASSPKNPWGYPYNWTTDEKYYLCVYYMPAGWPRTRVLDDETYPRGGSPNLQYYLDLGVPIPNPSDLPDGNVSPGGTDGAVVIIDSQTNELWELWQIRPSSKNGYTWACTQGGYMRNYKTHPGWWSAYNGNPGPYWGVSACGQSYAGSILLAGDYYGPSINHPLALGLQITGNYNDVLLPATRSDQTTQTVDWANTAQADPYRLPEGARFRLPTSFDIDGWVASHARSQADQYGTTAAVLKKILVCLRDYGCFVAESSGTNGISWEHTKVYGTRYHPYTAAQAVGINQWGNFSQLVPWASMVQVAVPSLDISVPGAGPA